MAVTIIPDFKNDVGAWVKYRGTTPFQVVTISGKKWNHVNTRCLHGGKLHKVRPNYIGCTMSDNFKNFQYFTDWHTKQVGYGVNGWHLDKDILVHGNTVYGEDTCVLVPQELNMFTADHRNARGNFPQGVYFNANYGGRYTASISKGGVRNYLGTFEDVDSAAFAYKIAKEAEAYRWYERLKAEEFIVDPRVIERMRTWTHICDWVAQ